LACFVEPNAELILILLAKPGTLTYESRGMLIAVAELPSSGIRTRMIVSVFVVATGPALRARISLSDSGDEEDVRGAVVVAAQTEVHARDARLQRVDEDPRATGDQERQDRQHGGDEAAAAATQRSASDVHVRVRPVGQWPPDPFFGE
jgi:hypothetical protein